jgi:hypothetical protein
VKVAPVLAASLLLVGTATTAREAVSVRVSPHISMAPATIRIVVTVEPDRDNRELLLQAESGFFYTSSTVELEGDRAPRLQSFVFKELPAGTYELEARVVRKSGDSLVATAEYMVMD